MGVIGSKSNVKQKPESQNESTEDDEPLIGKERVSSKEKVALGSDRDVPISDAEKRLHLYKKEQALGYASANTNKKASGKTNVRKQYKTSDFYSGGPKDDSRIPTKTSDAVFINRNKLDINSDNMKTGARTLSMTTQTSPKYPYQISPGRPSLSNPGTLIGNTFSQYCPNLLEQRKAMSDGPLQPVYHGRLGIDKTLIRNQLEEQGIIVNDPRGPEYMTDHTQQGIIGELKEIGIIQKVTTVENGYTMSSGSPSRRPPPRLTQIPSLDVDTAKIREMAFMDDGIRSEVLLDNETQTDNGISGIYSERQIETARNLKIKILDMEML